MLTLACCTTPLHGKEPEKSLPSKAFLEYLSELQEVKGELISPIDMLDIDDLDLPVTFNKQSSAIKPIEGNKSQKVVEKVVEKVVHKVVQKEGQQ
jgi:hypothetical protein